MAEQVWGDEETKFFYELTPDRILDTIEKASGHKCTGRIMALNSMENRVYEVEIEPEDEPQHKSDAYRIAKFYRPGRWTKEQILEEHQFLFDLLDNEIPAVAPERFTDGTSLQKMDDADIWFTLFPKVGGRSPDELAGVELEKVARLLARLHNVGASRPANHRLRIDINTYGRANLAYLLENDVLPENVRDTYRTLVESICTMSEPLFAHTDVQRIHGDCHFGNLLKNDQGFFWVDFDDMLVGPPVQDIWLIIPGRDEYAKEQLRQLIAAYEVMRPFDHASVRLIESLRALRFVHFHAWIAKRWSDPAFPRAFPYFGTERYWFDQIQDLREQVGYIQTANAYDYR